MDILNYLFFFIACFTLTATCLKYFIRYARHNLLDTPNYRSSHKVATPRGAGIVFSSLWCFIFLLSCYLTNHLYYFTLIFPSLFLMILLGYFDDRNNVSAKVKFCMQSISTGLLLYNLSPFTIPIFSYYYLDSLAILFAALFILWSTNLFNFMDGIDGFAAVESTFLFTGTGIIFSIYGITEYSMISLSIIPFILGFLYWNWPSAKIFMGDTGSYFLGFLFSALAVIGATQYNIPILLWIILYGIFWFDATVTLIRRILNKQKFYVAHKSHAYQRLHSNGWNTKKILYSCMLLNLILISLTLYSATHIKHLSICFIVSLLVLYFTYIFIERLAPWKEKC